jgi:hypothetical protein
VASREQAFWAKAGRGFRFQRWQNAAGTLDAQINVAGIFLKVHVDHVPQRLAHSQEFGCDGAGLAAYIIGTA